MKSFFRSNVILSIVTVFCVGVGLGSFARANVLGDMQTFVPNTDGLDFITVHSSRPLNQGFFAVGGHFSYARNHLMVFRDLNKQDYLHYHDQLVEFDTDISYAVSKNLGVFMAIPTLLWQESQSGQDVEVDVYKGIHGYRPGFKYTFGSSPEAFAFVGSLDLPRVKNSPYTGIDPKPILNLELAKNWKRPGFVTYGLNVGYRFRQPTTVPSDAQMFPLDDQVTFSMGRSAPLFKKTGWVAEAIFSTPVDKDPYKERMHASSIDLLLGVKHRVRTNLNMDAGVTAEPFVESQSPQFRVFAGLVYYFKPKWPTYNQAPEIPQEKEPEVVRPVGTVDQELASMSDTGEIPGKAPKAMVIKGLTVEPLRTEIFEGGTVDFKVVSANEPIVMELVRGKGIIYDSEFRYRAPLSPQRVLIRFTDGIGQVKEAQVIVKKIPRADKTLRIKNLKFVFATSNLIPSSKKEIRRIVRVLRGKKLSRIIVEGHTDSIGSNRYNLELSEKRARAVKSILMEELHLTSKQVEAIGFGEERPVATNKTDAGRQQNRRVDLKIYY
jgi:outer membrane protein OmpA-like peptidoglycan-associated protein